MIHWKERKDIKGILHVFISIIDSDLVLKEFRMFDLCAYIIVCSYFEGIMCIR